MSADRTSPDDDAILVDRILVPCALGVTSGERKLRRSVQIDLEVGRSLVRSGRSDRLSDTLDYGLLFEAVRSVAESSEFKLVEALAECVADALLARFAIDWVRVEVRKSRPLSGAV